MNKKSSLRLLLIGCGKMGGAMVDGWLNNGLSKDNIVIVKPSIQGLSQHKTIKIFTSAADIPDGFLPDFVIIAVKPNIIDSIIHEYSKYIALGSVFLSVAAGKKLSFLQNLLGADAKIIRAMPNLPATIAKGTTAMVANSNIDSTDREKSQFLMSCIGNVHWLNDVSTADDGESLMDAVTAISGSGPAYLFLFIESLINAGVKAGLDKKLSAKLALETIYGASFLAYDSSLSAEELRKSVTSKNGTTQAALDVLMSNNILAELVNDAVTAAKKRSSEI